MKALHLLAAGVATLALATGNAFAQSETAKKQAEIKKVAQGSLERFYKAEPKLKAEVAKAPGHAVFTSYGFSFLLGGSGGKGLVHNAKTKTDTFMDMAQVSAGIQIGGGQYETLIIFKSVSAMEQFINKGWEFGGEGGATAGAGGKTAGGVAGEQVINDALYYTLTKTGLQAGGAVAGTKFWKDKDLN